LVFVTGLWKTTISMEAFPINFSQRVVMVWILGTYRHSTTFLPCINEELFELKIKIIIYIT